MEVDGMATEPNVTFDPKQRVVRDALIMLEAGVVHISVTGEPSDVNTYLEEVKIRVALRQGEESTEVAPSEPQDEPTFYPDDEGALWIVIEVVESLYQPFVLELDVDPATVPEGKKHVYEPRSFKAVAIGIENQGNDPDCYLNRKYGGKWVFRRRGVEQDRPWPLNKPASQMTVNEWLADSTSNMSIWQLVVYGQDGKACSYNLYGSFQGVPYTEQPL
jgi:hypothetical protein